MEPLIEAGPVVVAHAAAAILAMVLGAFQLATPKGTIVHRGLGYTWVALLGFVATSSFLIHDFRMIGPFSPIHILSAVTLVALWRAIAHARAGRIDAHRKSMAALYALALVVTGLFTLLPGRTMHAVVIGG